MASSIGAHSLPFAEAMYASYLKDPGSVSDAWQAYFKTLGEPAPGNGAGPKRLGPTFRPPGYFAARHAAPAEGPSGPGPSRAPASVGQAPSAPKEVLRRSASGLEDFDPLPFLRALSIFSGLPEEVLQEVASIAEDVAPRAGDALVREGQIGRDLYVVTEGAVEVQRGGRILAELGVGEVVGEMAVLDHQPRSADVVAKKNTRLLAIHGERLLVLLETQPSLTRGVIQMLTRRLRETGSRQDSVDQLIRAYRVRGHLIADIDPVGPPKTNPELSPDHYGLKAGDLDSVFSSATIPGAEVMSLRAILAHLEDTYCRSIGVQFMHIDDLAIKGWLQERMESTKNTCELSQEEQLRILTKLTDAEILEQFIHKKFVGAKRFSLEGAESLIPLLDMAIEKAGVHGVDEVVIGMAHRGRLNVLANIIGKSPREIFREFDDSNPERSMGRGDVKYHLGYSSDRVTASGHRVHLSLCFNPSHLECVSPVVLGRVRAKQDRFRDVERRRGLGIIIHGDAAFAGQGVVPEMLNMSELHGYRVGGTLHIIVNNQIGFTTLPEEGRSTQYSTDVAKMLQIPIFHVNGEHPEAVAQAIRLATEFREKFRKDAVIDMLCYRRYGHNEGDEPAFTQPLLYERIRKRKSVREAYLENLYAMGGVTPEQAEKIAKERRKALEADLGAARANDYQAVDISSGEGVWRGFCGGRDSGDDSASTGVPQEELSRLLTQLTRLPEGFEPHRKLKRLLDGRAAMARGERPLDWAAAEALAFASLVVEGHPVRLSGQDSGRGTFSHRHAVLHDQKLDQIYTPLQHLSDGQASFEVRNSPLTETAVLGFEYGYSLDYPEALVLWEAQFGDFVNVAQVIIDQFLASGEDKWRRLSGLTLLLPHGFEGQGPEHSSARLERFLGAAAEDNIQVCNLTTPAQLFHALRRQVLRPLRKPLILMSPKSLLRHPKAVSTLDDLSNGRFSRVLPDDEVAFAPSRVQKVLLTSGKLYYELLAAREAHNISDIALLRVEQYYPACEQALGSALGKYPHDTPVVWVQEEPRNMGAWWFLRLRLGERVFGRMPLSVVARPESASPATGSQAAHKKEQKALIEEALGIERLK